MSLLRESVLAEVLTHRARSVAVVSTVAAGAALLTAALVLGASMQTAVRQAMGVEYRAVDVVVRTELNGGDGSASQAGADTRSMRPADVRRIAKVDGVAETASLVRSAAVAQVGSQTRGIALESLASDPSFVWQHWSSGRSPVAGNEVALSAETLRTLGIGLGDQVALGHAGVGRALFQVVGVVDVRGSAQYGASAYGIVTPAVAQSLAGIDGVNVVLVRSDPGRSADRVIAGINESARVGWPQAADDLARASSGSQGVRLGALSGVVAGFAVLALLVAALVLATTTTVSLASRRQALALVRCAGATRTWVARLVVSEVCLLGAAGAVVGVLAGIALAAATAPLVGLLPSLPDIPVSALTVTAGAVLWPLVVCGGLSLAAALYPAWRVSRIPPAAALRVETPASRSVVAARVGPVVGGALVAAGVVLAVLTTSLWGTVVAALLFLAAGVVLLPSALAVAARLVPRLPGFGRDPVRVLAADWVERQPTRAAAEGVAVLLASAMVTLTWVGLGSVGETVSSRLDASGDPDLTIGSPTGAAPLGPDVLRRISAVDGVAKVLPLPYGEGVTITGRDDGRRVRLAIGTVGASVDDLDRALPRAFPVRELRADTVYLPSSSFPPFAEGARVRLSGPDGAVSRLRVAYVDRLGLPSLVAPTLLAEVTDTTAPRVAWVRAESAADRARVVEQVTGQALMAGQLPVGGPLLLDLRLARAVDTARVAATALLALAVLVAAAGAASTAALSVAERRWENALLRALGLDRHGLRRLLLFRALLVGVVGTALGSLVGLAFGALVSRGVAGALGVPSSFELPVVPVLVLLVAVVLVVRAAHVVPMEHAARVRPARALAGG